jgi:hypothetical protein
MNDTLYKRSTPRLLYWILSALLCAGIYAIAWLPNGNGHDDMKQTLREQQLQDAEKDLLDAEATLHRLHQYEQP